MTDEEYQSVEPMAWIAVVLIALELLVFAILAMRLARDPQRLRAASFAANVSWRWTVVALALGGAMGAILLAVGVPLALGRAALGAGFILFGIGLLGGVGFLYWVSRQDFELLEPPGEDAAPVP